MMTHASLPPGVPQTPDAIIEMIRNAGSRLVHASTAADILVAQQMSGLAHDAARRALRAQKAVKAHRELVDSMRRLQADALEIEVQAGAKLAALIDGAQEEGDCLPGRHSERDSHRRLKLKDYGVTKQRLHDGRKYLVEITRDPHAIRRALDQLHAGGAQITRQTLRKLLARQKDTECKVAPVCSDKIPRIAGHDIQTLSWLEIDALIYELSGKLAFLRAVKSHVANVEPGARVVSALSPQTLKSLWLQVREDA